MRLSPRVLCGLSPSEFAATTVRPSVQSTVVRVLEYLEAHVFEPELTVERVLSDCGVRDHNFTAYFHLVTGLGLYQLIEKERMRGAKALLVETNWPIWRIAFTVGYSSPVSFSRAFRRAVGHSAKAWRASNGGARKRSCKGKCEGES